MGTACPHLPAVNILGLIRQGAGAMWLLSTSTATFVITADVQVCYYIHAVTDDRVSAPQTP